MKYVFSFQIDIPSDLNNNNPITCSVEFGGPIATSGECTSCEVDDDGCLVFDCTNLTPRSGQGLSGNTCYGDAPIDILDSISEFKPLEIRLDPKYRVNNGAMVPSQSPTFMDNPSPSDGAGTMKTSWILLTVTAILQEIFLN
jgi:hypothetical protein